MTKYILKARAGLANPKSQELDWTEEDFEFFEAGDSDMTAEARGLAMELVGMDFWVEKVEV